MVLWYIYAFMLWTVIMHTWYGWVARHASPYTASPFGSHDSCLLDGVVISSLSTLDIASFLHWYSGNPRFKSFIASHNPYLHAKPLTPSSSSSELGPLPFRRMCSLHHFAAHIFSSRKSSISPSLCLTWTEVCPYRFLGDLHPFHSLGLFGPLIYCLSVMSSHMVSCCFEQQQFCSNICHFMDWISSVSLDLSLADGVCA